MSVVDTTARTLFPGTPGTRGSRSQARSRMAGSAIVLGTLQTYDWAVWQNLGSYVWVTSCFNNRCHFGSSLGLSGNLFTACSPWERTHCGLWPRWLRLSSAARLAMSAAYWRPAPSADGAGALEPLPGEEGRNPQAAEEDDDMRGRREASTSPSWGGGGPVPDDPDEQHSAAGTDTAQPGICRGGAPGTHGRRS